jgi:hypothetical protein
LFAAHDENGQATMDLPVSSELRLHLNGAAADEVLEGELRLAELQGSFQIGVVLQLTISSFHGDPEPGCDDLWIDSARFRTAETSIAHSTALTLTTDTAAGSTAAT